MNLLENFLNNQHLNLIENQTPVDNLKLLSIKKNHDSDDISINLNNKKSEININQNFFSRLYYYFLVLAFHL